MEKYNPNIIYEQAFNPPYKEPRFSGEENNVKILFSIIKNMIFI